MAAQLRAFATLLILFLALHTAFSADPPSPSPAPEGPPADSNSPISSPPANSPAASPSPDISSPPAPPPSSDSTSPSPSPDAPSPSPIGSPAADSDTSPSPSPAPEANFRAADALPSTTAVEKSSGGGASAGKKAGIAVGVLFCAGLVAVAGIIYKKRQDNIRRSQYGYATRTGLI